jgi:hypothetical protein
MAGTDSSFGGAIPTGDASTKVVYWHRELPPPDAQPIAEHTIEAASTRVRGAPGRRDRVWLTCYDDLMAQTERRLEQEVIRLGGHYAHVFDEAIDIRHDDATGEGWLHGRFDYVLYQRSSTGEGNPTRRT